MDKGHDGYFEEEKIYRAHALGVEIRNPPVTRRHTVAHPCLISKIMKSDRAKYWRGSESKVYDTLLVEA